MGNERPCGAGTDVNVKGSKGVRSPIYAKYNRDGETQSGKPTPKTTLREGKREERGLARESSMGNVA